MSLVSILLVKLQIGPVGILLVVTQINLTFFLFRELSKPYQLRSVSVGISAYRDASADTDNLPTMRTEGKPTVPFPKTKNVSLKRLPEGDELMKWLTLVLRNVEFSRILPVLSSCLSMEQIDELISAKAAEIIGEQNHVKEEGEDMDEGVDEDNIKEECIKDANEENDDEGDEEEEAKYSTHDLNNDGSNGQSNDLDEILNQMKDPEKVSSWAEPKHNSHKPSMMTKSGTQSSILVVRDCKECSMVFKTRSAKKYHMEAIHSGRTFECSTCQKQFQTRNHLKNHSIVHQEVGKYLCNTCNKGFLRKQALIDHTRIHTGEKPFPCPRRDCSYRSSSSSLLAHHKRRQHK